MKFPGYCKTSLLLEVDGISDLTLLRTDTACVFIANDD